MIRLKTLLEQFDNSRIQPPSADGSISANDKVSKPKLTDDEKLIKAKKCGHKSWEDYKKSNWECKPVKIAIVGAGDLSNSGWQSNRSKFIGKYININRSNSNFKVTYTGPASGMVMSHAQNSSGDTAHQTLNVVMHELNPYLSVRRLRPVIDNISMDVNTINGVTTVIVNVPLEQSDSPWQIIRRGGWGHTALDGLANLTSLSVPGAVEKEGPVKKVANIKQNGKTSGTNLTEYFMAYKF
jgi:hypothetical protein